MAKLVVKTNNDNHLRSVVHKECVKADKLARLSSNELRLVRPMIPSSFALIKSSPIMLGILFILCTMMQNAEHLALFHGLQEL